MASQSTAKVPVVTDPARSGRSTVDCLLRELGQKLLSKKAITVPAAPARRATTRNARMPVILVVEDEFLVALDLQLTLEAAGYRVLGPAGSVDAALALVAAAPPDAAVLDFRLREETSAPVAAELRARGVPFVLATGQAGIAPGSPLAGVVLVRKPFAGAEIVRALREAIAGARRPLAA